MDRRSFCSLTAGALLSKKILASQSPAAEQPAKLRFAQERTGGGPFLDRGNGNQPHILLISADMVGPDLYHPARSLSKHVQIPAIRTLIVPGARPRSSR